MKFFEYRTWAWNQDLGDDSAAKFVLLALSQFADSAGECYPSHRRLAEMTGLSVRTVIRKVAALAALRMIDVQEQTRRNGSRSSNLYRLLADDPIREELSPDDHGASVTVTHAASDTGALPSYDTVAHPERLSNNYPVEEHAAASDDANAVAPSGDEPENDENGDDDMADDELFDVADVAPAAAQRIEARELDKQKNKRAQALTKVYTSRVKLSVFPAVMKVVRRTVDAGFTDQQIEYALKDLAASQRSVTVDSMRIALDAAPKPEPAPKPCPCCTQASEGSTFDLCAPCKDAFFRRNSSNCTHDAAMLDE